MKNTFLFLLSVLVLSNSFLFADSSRLRCTLKEKKNMIGGVLFEKTGSLVSQNFSPVRWKTPHGYTASFEPMRFNNRTLYRFIIFGGQNNAYQGANWVYKSDFKTCFRTLLWVNAHEPEVDFDYVLFSCSPADKPNGCRGLD